jgi:hypothetical protein
LIFVQRVNPNEFIIGDIITFYIDRQTVLTQSITVAHPGIGNWAFETSGLGTTHDILIPDANVIGRVILYYPDLGATLIAIPEIVLGPDNLLPVLGAFVVIMVLVFLLRGLFSRQKQVPKQRQMQKPKTNPSA